MEETRWGVKGKKKLCKKGETESDAKLAQRRRSRATAANERMRRRTKKTRSFPSGPAWETRNPWSVVGRWMISFYGHQNSTMVRNSVWYLEYFNTFLFSDANLSGIVLISGYTPLYIYTSDVGSGGSFLYFLQFLWYPSFGFFSKKRNISQIYTKELKISRF
jgi:hypothetical protein